MTTLVTPMLIFTVSYLAIFFLLIGMMPVLAPNLLYGGKEYSQSFTVPSYFSSADIENIKYFRNETLTWGMNYIVIDFNPDGVNFKFEVSWDIYYSGLRHRTWEWAIFHTSHIMNIETEGHVYITKANLISAWDSNINASSFYPVFCNHITVKIWYVDTNTTRNDIGEAWDEGSIDFGVGFGIDDVSTSYTAFNLIGLLLTFQSPEIFGASGIVALTLNLIANSPIYLSIAYLVFYFITSIIPFIRGA